MAAASHAEVEAGLWSPAGSQPSKGAVLVSHGLNCSPRAMDEFARVLNRAGFDTLQLAFRSCRAREERSRFEEVWLSDFAEGCARLRQLRPSGPYHHLGFSLGGLVAVASLRRDRALRFDRMALVAPALSVCRAAALLRPLALLAPLGLCLPSFCPPAFRSRRVTPLAEYQALLRLVAGVQALPSAAGVGSVRTRVFLEPGDELVSYHGVCRWVARNGGPGWAVETVRRDREVKGLRRHLLLDETTAGRDCWNRLAGGIVDHFTAREEAT